MRKESPFQTDLIRYLNSLGLWALRYAADGSGQLYGVPDIIVLNRLDKIAETGWHTILVETKREGEEQRVNQKIVSDLVSVFAPTCIVDSIADAEVLGYKLTGINKPFKRR